MLSRAKTGGQTEIKNKQMKPLPRFQSLNISRRQLQKRWTANCLRYFQILREVSLRGPPPGLISHLMSSN